MEGNGTGVIDWRLRGRIGPAAIDADFESRYTLNVLTGRIEEHTYVALPLCPICSLSHAGWKYWPPLDVITLASWRSSRVSCAHTWRLQLRGLVPGFAELCPVARSILSCSGRFRHAVARIKTCSGRFSSAEQLFWRLHIEQLFWRLHIEPAAKYLMKTAFHFQPQICVRQLFAANRLCVMSTQRSCVGAGRAGACDAAACRGRRPSRSRASRGRCGRRAWTPGKGPGSCWTGSLAPSMRATADRSMGVYHRRLDLSNSLRHLYVRVPV